MNKKNKGFTLVEVIIVIAILGILASISTVAVFKIRDNQEIVNKENIISSILTGAKVYNVEHMGTNEISVQDLIKGDYVDFDTTKYSDLVNLIVEKESCKTLSNNALKSYYFIEIYDTKSKKTTTYNDCGCEEQVSGKKANTICTN